MDSWQDFQTNQGREINKWEHYFPAYERHFAPWRGRSVTFLEIGVAKGGSLPMWRRYFGPMAKIVGIDIDKKCKSFEGPGVAVRIGDQSDPGFLQSLIDEFGPFDVVLDDGSHKMEHVRGSFTFLYPLIPKNGVYMVEDLHTAYWPEYGGGRDNPETFINYAKDLIDELNADHSRGAISPTPFTRQTWSICCYDSLIAFEKGDVWRKQSMQTKAGKIKN